MFSVGLTGGIASGKTTVSNLFADLGVPIVDTDVISRKLLDPSEPAYHQVTAHFGAAILTPDARIDRARLREMVFSDPRQKSWLEKMLHPLIYQGCHNAMLKHAAAVYVLVVVPLLFETNFQSLVDRILVVDCSAEQQVARLMKRDGIDEILAGKMLAQQMSNAQRLSRAHDIIENDSDTADLVTQVNSLHQSYLKRAAAY
jgi:dephospho-CoA kinase